MSELDDSAGESRRCSVVGLTALAALASVIAAPVPAGAELMVMDDGRAVAPFMLMLGDDGNWAQPVPGVSQAVSSSSGALRLEAEEEGLRATWDGSKPAQIYLQTAQPVDVSGPAAANAALVALLKVNRAPDEAVELRMACGYPCQAEADVTRLFQAVPVDTWGTVSFALSCFIREGLQTDRVDAPFVLATSGEFSVSLREVAIIEDFADKATVKCD